VTFSYSSGLLRLYIALLLGTVGASLAFAQDPGPLPTPPAGRTQPVHPKPAPQDQSSQPDHGYHSSPPPERIHSPGDNPITKDPPSTPVEDIIKRFAEKEAQFKAERDNYTYSQTFSIQTLDEDGRPDGMKVDTDGRLYVCAKTVQVFAPGGRPLGVIDCSQMPANCAWGEDGSTLFITARTAVYKARLAATGIAPFLR